MAKEQKLAVCRKHWSAFILPGIIALLFIIAFILELSDSVGAALIILVIPLVIVLYIFISYKTTYLALTETRVLGHTGFIKSKTLTTPISKVQDIRLSNGLFGKVFGYHTIVITNAGTAGTELPFTQMAKAQAFVDAVEEQMKKIK